MTRGVCASWQQSHSVSVPAPASQPRRRFQSPDVTGASSWTSAQEVLSPLGRTEPCHGRRAASRNRAECASHAISQGTQRTWSHRGEQARGSSKSVWRKRRRRAAVGARPRNRMLEPRLRWAVSCLRSPAVSRRSTGTKYSTARSFARFRRAADRPRVAAAWGRTVGESVRRTPAQ